MSVRILIGDVRDKLRELPDESVHCAITSPPYWGLRDYGVTGQLGLEPTLGEHVAVMVEAFREVRRVLRSDGTLWLNYGDCYASSINGRSAADTKAAGNDDRTFRDKPFSTVGPIYEQQPDSRQALRRGRSGNLGNGGNGGNGGRNGKSLPTGRIVAGGFLKPKDLCGIPWRVAFALQDDGWWLRQDIIWSKPNPMPESITDRCTKAHEYLFLLTKSERYYFDADAIKEQSITGDPRRPYTSEGAWALDGRPAEQRHGGESRLAPKAAATPRHDGERWNENGGRGFKPRTAGNKSHKYVDAFEASETEEHRTKAGLMKVAEVPWHSRNRRSVWTIATAPYSEAHFATFPQALVKPCILAGSPKGGTVLDPFGGAGTTGLVADRLGRDAILIELNPEYAEMARRRIDGDAPLFSDIAYGSQLSAAE